MCVIEDNLFSVFYLPRFYLCFISLTGLFSHVYRSCPRTPSFSSRESLCSSLFYVFSTSFLCFRMFRFTHVLLSTANAYSSTSSSCEFLYRSIFYLFPISFTGIFPHMYRCQPPMPIVVLPLPPRRPAFVVLKYVCACVCLDMCVCVLSAMCF